METPRWVRTTAPLLVAVLLAMLATPSVAEETPQKTPLRFRRLSTDQGLSDSTVEAVLQDHKGFIWIGTADGLNRYDGYTFKVFSNDPEDPETRSLVHEDSFVFPTYESKAALT